MKIQTHLTEPQGKIEIPPRMKAALEQYQKRVWTIKLAEGVLAAIFWYPYLIYHRVLLRPDL